MLCHMCILCAYQKELRAKFEELLQVLYLKVLTLEIVEKEPQGNFARFQVKVIRIHNFYVIPDAQPG